MHGQTNSTVSYDDIVPLLGDLLVKRLLPCLWYESHGTIGSWSPHDLTFYACPQSAINDKIFLANLDTVEE